VSPILVNVKSICAKYYHRGDDSGVTFLSQTSAFDISHVLSFRKMCLKPGERGLRDVGVETRLGTNYMASSGMRQAVQLHYCSGMYKTKRSVVYAIRLSATVQCSSTNAQLQGG